MLLDLWPIYPLYERDRFTGELIEGGTYDRGDFRPEASGRHAVWENKLNEDLRKDTNLNVRSFADFYFLDDFTFTVNATIDRRYNNRERARNAIIGDAAPGGDAYRYGYVYTGITFNQLLNYQTDIRDHSINALVGHESFQYERDYTYMRREQQVVEGNTELINYVNLMSGTSNKREYRKEGYFTRVSYDYASTYYLSGSLRYDGSSRFRSGVRWDTFWSLGAAWRLDQEDFMRDIDWVNSLKLRGSYGEVGNDSHTSHASLSFYAYQALYELGYNNASEAGILLGTAGNPDLLWEANAQTDIALEFELFDSRFRGTVEWYHRETSDLLFDVPLPVSSGISEYPDNIGTMFNRGIELTFDMDVIRKQNFQWNLVLQGSTLRNEFKELPQDEIINGTKKLMVGRSIYDYWLRQWYGVDPSDGSALYIASEEAIEAGGSDIRTVDGTTVTTNQNNAEYAYVGTAIPDLFGSVTNRFSFKGFTLSALLTYQIGGKTYDSNYSGLMHPGSTDGRALHSDILDRWQQPGDETNVPRLDRDQAAAFNAASSRWLVSSSYLALRNVNLSYSFDPTFVNQFGIRNASVYVNAENLTAITGRKGLEPIQQFNGTTNPRYTPSRVLTLGVNFTF
ncbi:SusC/RagA family TonB-linked outer membrane protein [Rhodohalobacter halophilus]|uniref:SusC/RagA family TonB-linked outer membrane protein n=1 Tax=Rhodohalobacter halophilus TaxID=1812810 RepID=UPI000A9D79E8|nr:SusC/RagA family TonB-linked outer membrane protein [Rhodohalobacter halophilus]